MGINARPNIRSGIFLINQYLKKSLLPLKFKNISIFFNPINNQ